MTPEAVFVDDACLRRWPLPMPGADGDKEDRGRVLVIGGSPELAGAVVLAAIAALRAGAGKLAIATSERVAASVAIAVPEARVVALRESGEAGLLLDPRLFEAAFDAVLIGPGMQDKSATCALVDAALARAGDARIVLDAAAMEIVRGSADPVARRRGRGATTGSILLTPHAGELARLSGLDKQAILADPSGAASTHAAQWGLIVALKGATTVIASPHGNRWVHEGGNIGLAVSGSGDTLAGIIAGLAARGATLEQAAAWGVAMHARAGDVLARRFGPLGFLAREIAGEIPMLMESLRQAGSHASAGFTSG